MHTARKATSAYLSDSEYRTLLGRLALDIVQCASGADICSNVHPAWRSTDNGLRTHKQHIYKERRQYKYLSKESPGHGALLWCLMDRLCTIYKPELDIGCTHWGVSSEGPMNNATIFDDVFAFTRLKLSASSMVTLSSFFFHLLFLIPAPEFAAQVCSNAGGSELGIRVALPHDKLKVGPARFLCISLVSRT